MKRLEIFFCLFSCLTSTYASTTTKAATGFYLGGDLVFANYNTPAGTALSSSLFSSDISIRPFIGYRFNDYFALETGYDSIVNIVNKNTNNSGLGPDHYKLTAIDVATKWIYSLPHNFSVYGKIGFAYVHQDDYNVMFVGMPPLVDTNTSKILPLVGVGASYNFTRNLAGEIFATYMARVDPIGPIRMVGVGVGYTFGG